MKTLLGECNQCGVCCLSLDRTARCENLIIEGNLGTENATRCGAWSRAYRWMPIKMLRFTDNSLAYESKCAFGFAELVREGFPLKLPVECTYQLVQLETAP